MSINLDPSFASESRELTELGKRIEVLRIGRGLSKQHLARHAGTSRQQLWRVMTGKSELTPSLRQRLSAVLRVSSVDVEPEPTTAAQAPAAVSLDAFVHDPVRLELVLQLLPSGEDGRRIKRLLLNGLEDVALERGVDLGAPFFELRRRVLSGDL